MAATDLPGWTLLRDLPFEPGRGFHAVLGATPAGRLISVKGAPEVVLPRCTGWRRPGGVRPLTDRHRRRLDAEIDQLAGRGYRVLAVAERAASARADLDPGRLERLEFVGLLGLADQVRPTAAEAVRRLRQAGVSPVMLTGDHPATAAAIAAELGMLNGHPVVTGPQIDALSEADLARLAARAPVFARVTPAHKVTIVRALRAAGRVVAVTGDGANDAPAIRLADVGIALGHTGTAAARAAADIVVTDDRIETILDAVVEGRALWVSVRDAVAQLVGGNLGEVAFTLGGSLLAARAPLNARQLLLINLVTDVLPALALAARPPRNLSPQDLLREGPEASLGGRLTRDITTRAVTTATAGIAGWLAARLTGSTTSAGTVALCSLVGAQLAQTVITAGGDPLVLAAAGGSAVILAGAVELPLVSGFFGCRPLGPVGAGIAAGAALTGVAVGAASTLVPIGVATR